jgi:hypothetical protein
VLKVLMALLLAALVSVPAAAAARPQPTAPAPSVTTVVVPVHVVPDVQAFPGGLTTATAPHASAAAVTAGSCGACLVTCWSTTTRSGPSDFTGHAFIYQHLSWCGNGAQIVGAGVGQSYDQDGAYRITSSYGPSWSGGCVGCGSIRASGYIFWSWTTPILSLPQNGTSHLDSTMYAYGGFST